MVLMASITGKISNTAKIFYLLLFVLNLNACDLSVKILNYNGDHVSRAQVGVPFQLHIIEKGDCEVDRLEFATSHDSCRLNYMGAMKSIHNINGSVSRSNIHKYLARIDRPGIYKLGPIKAWQGLNLVGNLDLQIEVCQQENMPVDIAKNPAVEFKSSSSSLYVGEQFTFNIKFYFLDNQITAPELTMPAGFDDWFELESKSVPNKYSEQRNGILVNCWQWQILATAKKAGQFLMPAVSVSFEKIDQRHSFFRFVNQDKNTLFSNTINLDVRNLPENQETAGVLGVGHFTDFTMTVDHATLSSDQAAQLKLELVGKGNWSKISINHLEGLPVNLQAYAGRAVSGENYKQFEFVLQGVQAGSCVIPPQVFNYFDTESQQYQKIFTKPINLTVLHVHQKKDQAHLIKKDLAVALDHNIKPILESGAIKYHKNYYLPISLWLAVSLGLVLVFLLKASFVWCKFFLNKHSLCLLGLLFSTNLIANLEEKFLQANQFYQAGDFVKAQEIYESIDFPQGRGAVVWYNLGNCYFQQTKLTLAIEAWLQAGKIGNWQIASNCLANILVTQAYLDIKQEANYLPSFWFRSLILYDNFLSLQLLLLLVLVLLFACLIRWPNYFKLFWSLVILFVCLIIYIAILCAKENNLSYAVVQNNSKLVAGPGRQYHDLGSVKSGTIFKMVQELTDWCQIQDERGLQNGWLLKQDLRIV